MRHWLRAATAAILSLLATAPAVAQEVPILRVSKFMMPPRSTWALIGPSTDANVVVTDGGGDAAVGFRAIHLRRSTHATKQAAVDLALSGLLRSGDILLSFRPLWDGTLAYAHMQLGVSHSALAFVVSDAQGPLIMTLESPISYSSPMNYPEHYADLDAIHVIRPELSPAQVANLERWARLAGTRKDRLEFFSDYATPMYKRGVAGVAAPRDEARLLAEILLGREARKFESYCSEFVWAMLSLRDCDPASFTAACVKPPFSTASGMMTGLVPRLAGDSGLVQGAEAALTTAKTGAADRTVTLTQKVFVDVLTDEAQLAGRMSSGHIQVAKASRSALQAVNGYYAGGEPAPVAAAVNAGIPDNVSPTSYLIRSNAGMDGFRYVGTVVFDR